MVLFSVHFFQKILNLNTLPFFSVSELPPVPSTSRTSFAELSVRQRMRDKLKAARVRILQKSWLIDLSLTRNTYFILHVLYFVNLSYLLFYFWSCKSTQFISTVTFHIAISFLKFIFNLLLVT